MDLKPESDKGIARSAEIVAAYFIRIVVLWFPFSVTAILAILTAPIVLMVSETQGRNILRAMDKLGAAVLGYSGFYTLSAECGKSECEACKLVCAFLHLIDPDHCAKAAKKEGR